MPEDKMTAGMREQLASVHHRRGQAHMALAGAEHARPEESHEHEAEGCAALCRAIHLYRSLEDGDKRMAPELSGELTECSEYDCAVP